MRVEAAPRPRTVPPTALPLAAAALVLALAGPAAGLESTFVTTFDQDFYNWAVPHEQTFQMPPASESYSQVLLHYDLGCPGPPADCDPWDRLGYLRLLHTEPDLSVTPYEIARIVTPFDITGGNFPGSCSWTLDVTDYRFLLQGEVVLSNYIESWIGDDRGWLATLTFEFVRGPAPEQEAFRIDNLWTVDRLVFGNPANPVTDHLQTVEVAIAPETSATKIRAITTGHGQGNTDNAAEFSLKTHGVSAGGTSFEHALWRNDCGQNVCSPQGGTWWFNRAGWCPGDKVDPWDVDVTAQTFPGSTVAFGYQIEPYENLCRPDNPSCVSGVTCSDCNFNFTGHTEPVYNLNTQLIQYRHSSRYFATGFETGDLTAWTGSS